MIEERQNNISLEKQQEQNIEVLIKARYPIIWLVTHEENRAKKMLFNIAQPDNGERDKYRTVYLWDCVKGLRDESPWKKEDDKQKFENTESLPLAIQDVYNIADEGFHLIVFYDLHSHIEDTPLAIRALKNLAIKLDDTYKNIIVISPELVVPTELEKFITVVDLELPSSLRLEAELNHFIGELQEHPKRNELLIDFTKKEKEDIIHAAQGLTAEEFAESLAKSIVAQKTIDKDIILDEKRQAVRKSGALEFYDTQEDLNSVGGMDNLKEYILERSDCFSEDAIEYGLPNPKGVLLLGIQGCGKSLMCKAVSSLWGMPLLRMDIGALFGGFVGESESNMRNAVKLAEAVSPCILWVDEIEKGLSGSQSSNFSDSGTTSRVFGFFITWMQEKTKPVYLIATANDVTQLPPELLRKGRFDEIFFVDLPVDEEREDIFKIHLTKRQNETNKIEIASFDFDELITKSKGYSGAEIEQAIIDALYKSFSEGMRPLSQEDIIYTLGATKPLSVTMKENIEAAREWIEGRARKASSAGEDVIIPELDSIEDMQIEL